MPDEERTIECPHCGKQVAFPAEEPEEKEEADSDTIVDD